MQTSFVSSSESIIGRMGNYFRTFFTRDPLPSHSSPGLIAIVNDTTLVISMRMEEGINRSQNKKSECIFTSGSTCHNRFFLEQVFGACFGSSR
jgi:hypothetical protein